jgi:hypothetical protein
MLLPISGKRGKQVAKPVARSGGHQPFEGAFSIMGASKVGPCLEDCTINTYGFNLRQGQPCNLSIPDP